MLNFIFAVKKQPLMRLGAYIKDKPRLVKGRIGVFKILKLNISVASHTHIAKTRRILYQQPPLAKGPFITADIIQADAFFFNLFLKLFFKLSLGRFLLLA